AAFLAQNNEGPRPGQPGRPATVPVSTITAKGSQQTVVSAGLARGHGCRSAEVRAFLTKYYGQGVGQAAGEPMHTLSTRDRMGLVMVHGEPYEIVDIGMRMLVPRELFAAQGFPADYVIDE